MGPRVFISNKLPGDARGPVPRPHLGYQELRVDLFKQGRKTCFRFPVNVSFNISFTHLSIERDEGWKSVHRVRCEWCSEDEKGKCWSRLHLALCAVLQLSGRIHSGGGVSGVSCRNAGYCGRETQQLSNVSSRSVPPLGLGAQECIVPKRNSKERCLREASGCYPPGNYPRYQCWDLCDLLLQRCVYLPLGTFSGPWFPSSLS